MQISPYAKLLPMLMGIGSPGTLQEVVRGYVGDKESKPVFDSPTPFDILGAGFQVCVLGGMKAVESVMVCFQS